MDDFRLKEMDERQRAEFIRRFQQARRFDRQILVHETEKTDTVLMALQVAALLVAIGGLLWFLVSVGVL